MENYIRKLPGKQYLARLEKNPTVIIPTGACEVYGPLSSHGHRSAGCPEDR